MVSAVRTQKQDGNLVCRQQACVSVPSRPVRLAARSRCTSASSLMYLPCAPLTLRRRPRPRLLAKPKKKNPHHAVPVWHRSSSLASSHTVAPESRFIIVVGGLEPSVCDEPRISSRPPGCDESQESGLGTGGSNAQESGCAGPVPLGS